MKHVCAALIRENGLIFVSDRPDSKAAAGKWEFPGGKIEPGETQGECIIREMREELGMNVIPLDTVYDFVHVYPGGAIHLIFIRCIRTDQKPPEAREGQHFRWIPVSELTTLDFLDADLFICRQIREACHI